MGQGHAWSGGERRRAGTPAGGRPWWKKAAVTGSTEGLKEARGPLKMPPHRPQSQAGWKIKQKEGFQVLKLKNEHNSLNFQWKEHL